MTNSTACFERVSLEHRRAHHHRYSRRCLAMILRPSLYIPRIRFQQSRKTASKISPSRRGLPQAQHPVNHLCCALLARDPTTPSEENAYCERGKLHCKFHSNARQPCHIQLAPNPHQSDVCTTCLADLHLHRRWSERSHRPMLFELVSRPSVMLLTNGEKTVNIMTVGPPASK